MVNLLIKYETRKAYEQYFSLNTLKIKSMTMCKRRHVVACETAFWRLDSTDKSFECVNKR